MARKKLLKKDLLSDFRPTTIGDRINFIQAEKARSGYKFAKSLNISSGNLSSLINDENKPSADLCARISEVYGVNLNWLLTGDGEPYKIEHTEDLGVNLQVISKAQSDAMKAGAVAAGVTLEEIVRIFSMGDESVNQSISTFLNILADTASVRTENQGLKESVKKQEKTIQRLESEIKESKTLINDLARDFRELINAIEKINDEDSPPASTGERRKGIKNIAHLIKQAQERIDHRGIPEIVLEDESLDLSKYY